MLQVLKKKKRS